MGSEIFEAYEAILTRDDPALAGVFRSIDGELREIFSQLDGHKLRLRATLVYDDRSRFPGAPEMRRWRPTAEVISEDGDLGGIRVEPGQMVVLTDRGFPATLEKVSNDLVHPASGNYSEWCQGAFQLVQMIGRFIQGYHSLEEQGGDAQQIREHPKMQEMAAAIHAASVQFSASYHEGITLPVRQLAPPPGSRQLPPALWLQRHAVADRGL